METIDKDNFEEKTKSGTVLVQFSADWCMPCKVLTPLVEKLSSKVSVFKVNTDDSPSLAKQFDVRSLPTIILFKDGKKVKERVGLVSEDYLNKFIE